MNQPEVYKQDSQMFLSTKKVFIVHVEIYQSIFTPKKLLETKRILKTVTKIGKYNI